MKAYQTFWLIHGRTLIEHRPVLWVQGNPVGLA